MSEKTTRKKAAEKQISKLIAYKKVFSGEFGTVVLNDLMKVHHVLSSSMGKDANEIIFKEGERNVVLRILKILQTDPETLRNRIKEIENEYS